MSDTYTPESNADYMERLDSTVFTPQPARDWTGAAPDWCDTCASAPCQCVTTQPVKRGRRVNLVNLSTVAFERVEWIKRNWYPAKVATMISGRGGTGKSSLTLADIAAGTRGELKGRNGSRPVRSILVTVEDSQGMQKARLKAAGADLDYVRVVEVQDAEYDAEVIPAIPGDLDEIETAAREFGADLIVFDPLSSLVRGDLNKSEIIRGALDPLSRMARNLNIAVVIVHHHRKGGGSGNDLASGSHAIRDTVRSSILCAYDEDSGERVLTFDKSSYSALEGSSLGYELQSVPMLDDDDMPVFDEDGNAETVAVAVVTGTSDTSVQDIVNRAPSTEGGSTSKVDEAEVWLEDYLSMHPNSLRSEIVSEGQKVRIPEDPIRRAYTKMKIVATYEGFPRVARWSLPVRASNSRSPHTAQTAHTAQAGGTQGVYPVESPESFPTSQSAQSAQSAGTENSGAQTVPALLCVMCDLPATPDTAFCSEHAGLATA